MIAFHMIQGLSHNAKMHMFPYTSFPAKALVELCRQRKTSRSGTFQLMKESGGLWRVNANALHNAMSEEGIELPQPTITRLLQGKESKPATIKALADFFSVKLAVVRGETDEPRRSEGETWPFDEVPYRDYDNLEPDQQAIIAGLVRYQVAEFKIKNGPRRRKKSAEY